MKRMKTARLMRRAGTNIRLWMRTASGLSKLWLGAAPRAGAAGRPAARGAVSPPLRTRAGAPHNGPLKAPGPVAASLVDSVAEVVDFGRNPGELRLFVYVPPQLPAANGPLIVVLHGCGQTAASFAADAGWIGLARRLGIPLVLAEQVRANNAAGCFNWFEPEDVRRGGEAASIRQMVRVTAKRFRTHPRKLFIVGLSAGGAMAAAMLAAYPATFAAGAVVAGMPIGVAHGVGGAILRMHHANGFTSRARLAEAVRARAPAGRRASWPRLSIWQGEQDRVVDPANAAVLAAQFGALHGCQELPDEAQQTRPGILRRRWGAPGLPLVELWTIAAMGHGFPIDPSLPGGGRSGAAVLDAGVSGADHMAAFFGLQPSPPRG